MYKKNHNAKTCDPPVKIIKVPLLFKPTRSDMCSPRSDQKSVATLKTWHGQSTDRKSEQKKIVNRRSKEQNRSVKSDWKNQKENNRSNINKKNSSNIKKTPIYSKKTQQSSILINDSIDKSSEAKRLPKSITDFKDIEQQQVSTERSCDTTMTHFNEMQDLRQRFIRKRSEVYQVLCNLDYKFDDIKNKQESGIEMMRNTPMSSKKDIMKMIDRKALSRR